MNKARLIILCVVLCISTFAFAQTEEEFFSEACCSGLSDEETLKLLDKALKKYPKSAKLYIERGNAKSRLLPMFAKEDNVAMMPDFDKAVSLAPDAYESYVARAEAYLNISKYAEALKDYDKAFEMIKKNGENYQIHDVLMGRVNTKQFLNNLKGAIDDILECIKLMPEDAGNKYQLIADLNVQLEAPQEALRYYNLALKSYQDSGDISGEASAHYGLAFLYIDHLKNNSEGCSHLKMSAALRPAESLKEDILKYCKE